MLKRLIAPLAALLLSSCSLFGEDADPALWVVKDGDTTVYLFGTVHVLDPFEVSGRSSAAYNPLDRLSADSPDLSEDAASLADALVVDPAHQTGDAHWNEEAKALIGGAARAMWADKRRRDGYDAGSGAEASSPKARMRATMEAYVDEFESVPAVVLPCYVPHRTPDFHAGASVYPACQNLLLAARARGYGGVLTIWHRAVENDLRALLGIPDEVLVAATITLGRPAGAHGPVRRRPMAELVYADRWGDAARWAVDPPGTSFTAAGPPRSDAQA
mgnify:CR=1 FL=1